ncbi:MAG: hypothetical protein WAZ48_06690 [Lysobacteraceae bacterium]
MPAPGGWRRWCGSTDLRRFRSGAKQWTIDEPGKANPWYQIGRLAAGSGQYLVEGEAALRTYLKLGRETGDPEPKHARHRLGQILAKAGRKDEAVRNRRPR